MTWFMCKVIVKAASNPFTATSLDPAETGYPLISNYTAHSNLILCLTYLKNTQYYPVLLIIVGSDRVKIGQDHVFECDYTHIS